MSENTGFGKSDSVEIKKVQSRKEVKSIQPIQVWDKTFFGIPFIDAQFRCPEFDEWCVHYVIKNRKEKNNKSIEDIDQTKKGYITNRGDTFQFAFEWNDHEKLAWFRDAIAIPTIRAMIGRSTEDRNCSIDVYGRYGLNVEWYKNPNKAPKPHIILGPSWFIDYRSGGWQAPHIHRGQTFSFCYCYKQPDAGGNLYLFNQNLTGHTHSFDNFYTQRNCIEYPYKKGSLVGLPAWLQHMGAPIERGEKGLIVFDTIVTFSNPKRVGDFLKRTEETDREIRKFMQENCAPFSEE
ncbi:MAG: hypothetical protein ACE5K1_05210 [Acidiferrobacterales bacterium]